jgi:hypothetical protein
MNIRKNIIILLVGLMPLSSAFAFVGFGLHFGQNQLAISDFSKSWGDGTFKRGGFDNTFAVGGYFYIDAIPFIDLDVEFQVSAKDYKLALVTGSLALIDSDFGWASATTYLTARKKLIGLGIPLLAKAKLHYGVGYNKHVITPMADLDMVEGLLTSASGSLEKSLTKYLEDNTKDVSGFHLQAGLKAKLLMGEVDLIYRYVMAKDLVPDSKGFSSLNLRLGLAF